MNRLFGEPLTSRLINVFELDGSGQPMEEHGVKVGYLRMPVRALCNKVQSATVISTSLTAMVGVNQGGGTDPPKIVLPASAFTVTERG